MILQISARALLFKLSPGLATLLPLVFLFGVRYVQCLSVAMFRTIARLVNTGSSSLKPAGKPISIKINPIKSRRSQSPSTFRQKRSDGKPLSMVQYPIKPAAKIQSPGFFETRRSDGKNPARTLSLEITNLRKRRAVNSVLDLYAKHRIGDFLDGIHLSNIFCAVRDGVRDNAGREKLRNDERFTTMMADTVEKLKTNNKKWLDVRVISSILQAVTKTKIVGGDHDLYKEVERNCDWIADKGDVQSLSNVVWSFAKCGNYSPALFEAVAKQQQRIVRNGKVQELGTILWAYQKFGHKDESMMNVIALEKNRICNGGSEQAIANICYAFGKFGIHNEALFDAVLGERDRLEKEGTESCVSNLNFAYTALGRSERFEKREVKDDKQKSRVKN